MFMALEEDELNVVIDAMDEKKAKHGDTIITEGEKGDVLYVVESGQLECFKQFVSNNTNPLINII
jgi:cAMP-dependent protein kinase regulator